MSAVLIVTLAYLAILVAVLAVGLILIAWRLTATAKAIRQIRDALAQLSGGLGSVLQWLILADGSLARIANRFRSSAA